MNLLIKPIKIYIDFNKWLSVSSIETNLKRVFFIYFHKVKYKIIIYFLIFIKLLSSILIGLHYLIEENQKLILEPPSFILISILIFAITQYISWQFYPKNISLKHKRFYYLGLTSICISIFFAETVNPTYLIILVKSCSWLLFISVLSEIHRIYKFKKWIYILSQLEVVQCTI